MGNLKVSFLMKKTKRLPFLALSILYITSLYSASCAEDTPAQDSLDQTVDDAGADADTDIDADADADADSDGDGDADGDDTTPENCGEEDLDLKLAGVKVMFLLDFSSSMTNGNKWADASAAIEKMVTDPANADTHFGLHVFPQPGLNPLNICSAASNPAVEVAEGTGQDIVDWMNSHKPGMFSMTPLVNAMQYYLGAKQTALHDSSTANYVILLSDGEDSCYAMEAGGQTILYPSHAFNMLAGITDDMKDVSHIKTIPIGLGNIGNAAEKQLNAIARNGGSSFDEYIPAADGPALEAALEEIAQSIRPCRYLVDSPNQSYDSSKINFYFDDNKVDRDRKHENGWDWTTGDELEVEFYGDACDQIKSGEVAKVNATFGCPTVIDGETCAEADFFLRFPGISVMYLLDVSTSMIAPARWSGATTAITNMIVDDRSNHSQFGLSAFPTGWQCSIAASPEVSLGGSDARLMIVEWLTHNMPSIGGGTPIVAGLQRLQNRPGGIEEGGVSGAVVVITDGNDTCAKTNVSPVVDQLTEITESLVDEHGVRVFAIGYQGGDKDQLDAIAKAGNTGLTSFQKATDQAELEDVLKQISSMVTTCVFNVPYAGADADYGDVNFYLDGEQVPWDTSEKDGWNWVNDVNKTEVEFFGDSCDRLKKGEVTDVVVEFGCEPLKVV